MKITGTRGDIDVEYNGRTAQFDGELGMHGFYAIRNSMRWLPPYEHLTVTTKDRDELVAAILDESKGKMPRSRTAWVLRHGNPLPIPQ